MNNNKEQKNILHSILKRKLRFISKMKRKNYDSFRFSSFNDHSKNDFFAVILYTKTYEVSMISIS